MTKLINEQWHFIDFIHKSPLHYVRRILPTILPVHVKVLCEIALNIKLENLDVKGGKISPSFINFMSKRSNSIGKKRIKILNNRKLVKHMIDSVYPSLHTLTQ
jgi:hypothetical protein